MKEVKKKVSGLCSMPFVRNLPKPFRQLNRPHIGVQLWYTNMAAANQPSDESAFSSLVN